MPALGSRYEEGPHSFIASGVINQGHAVKLTTALNTVEECDSAGENSYGVALTTVADGEQVSVLRRGRFDKAVAGAALATLNTQLQVTAAGKYIAAASEDAVVGWNRTTAAADGDAFVIELDTAERVTA